MDSLGVATNISYDDVAEALKRIFSVNVVSTIIVIVVAILLYKLIKKYILGTYIELSAKFTKNARTGAYAAVADHFLRYLITIIAFLVILEINNINVRSLLAGIGIASVVIGLAVQDALKDIIRGTTILSDEYFKVGDVVQYGDIEGVVLVFGPRSTKIRDLRTDSVVSVANRNIEQIAVLKGIFFLEVPLPYELDLESSEKAMREIAERASALEGVKSCEYVGINAIADSSINYYLKTVCDPQQKFQIRRNALVTVVKTLEELGISIPYSQIDVHEK
ncbi:MAG: mechanosensitive ion channel family protein [Lachnospiraceae bacterium]|nr:mechanosensitive ion channel family protein [Lachnospiraceae bacterium]